MNLQLFDEEILSPGEVLRQMLKERGWTQDELAAVIGKSVKAINAVICGRAGITPEMAVALAIAFGNTAADWMRVETYYRIAKVRGDNSTIQRKARLFGVAPVRDMQRRGWIAETNDADLLEQELKKFFEKPSLDELPEFPVSFLKKTIGTGPKNSAEKAWCFMARKMASVLQVSAFDPRKLEKAGARLRELAAYPKEARNISRVFAESGVRFVIVEHLPGTKIDGAAFWIDDNSPAIAVSVRLDRMDNFWFTVMHEVSHIKNGDALSVDRDLTGEDSGEPILIHDEAESRASEEAAHSLIPREEIESFIRRVGPLYSKDRIIQFAHRIKIHPGIVVGQLQNRKEIGWGTNKEMLVKIRAVVVETSLTDGWGRTVTPGLL